MSYVTTPVQDLDQLYTGGPNEPTPGGIIGRAITHSPHAVKLVLMVLGALKQYKADGLLGTIEEERIHSNPPGGRYDTFVNAVTVHIGIGRFTLRRHAKGIAVCRFRSRTMGYDPVLPFDATLADVLAAFNAVAAVQAA